MHIRPKVPRRALQIQHPLLNIHLAVRLVLELLHHAENILVRTNRLEQALLHHLVLAHLDVLHLVRQPLKILQREAAQVSLPVITDGAILDLARRFQRREVGLEVRVQRHLVGGLAQQRRDLGPHLADVGVVVGADGGARREGQGCVAGGRVEGLCQLVFGQAVVDVGAEVALDEEDAQFPVVDVAPAVGEARGAGLFEVEGEDVGAADGVDLGLEFVAVLAGLVLELVDGAFDVASKGGGKVSLGCDR